MAGETGEALKERILKTFSRLVDSDRELTKAEKALLDGGGYAEAYDYAGRTGDLLAEAYSRHIVELLVDSSPPSIDVIKDLFEEPATEVYNRAITAALTAQTNINGRYGLSLNSIQPAGDNGALKQLINGLAGSKTGGGFLTNVRNELPTLTNRAVDNVAQTNARAQYRAGISATITRRVVANCCPWCSARAGTFEYPKVPSDVYKRHPNCRCVVEYRPENGNGRVQNVHSKEWGPEETENVQDHVERMERPRKWEDVTQEYARSATPGQGQFDNPSGKAEDSDEVSIGRKIHSLFGGDISVLGETRGENNSNPDYLWNGKYWDLKSPHTVGGINKRPQHGFKQISENPGGIVIDLKGAAAQVSSKEVGYQLQSRCRESMKTETADFLIFRDGEFESALRFKKSDLQ